MKLWFLPATLILFSLLSVLTLSSIAPELAPRQLSFFLVGLMVFYAVSRVSFLEIIKFHWLYYGLVAGLLGYVLVLGELTRNTARWISLWGGLNLQPSQLAIPLVGLTAVVLLANRKFGSPSSVLHYFAVLLLPAVLILVEPDLGSTVIFLLCLGMLLLFTPLSWKTVVLFGAVGLIGSIFAWNFVLEPYQKERVFSFVATKESSDYRGAGYNARQSLIAVGAGGLYGAGLGQGVQSHLRFLPERQTDFIFASFAEEFGFVGSLLVLLLYGGLIGYCFYISTTTTNKSATYYCFLIGTMIAIQSSVNISMNMGLVPITGVTLPLLSYGGSSLLTIAGSLGIIQSIARETKPKITLHIS